LVLQVLSYVANKEREHIKKERYHAFWVTTDHLNATSDDEKQL
jgi:hypothetical protein